MPPDALTPSRPPTVAAISETAWTVAPPAGWKPVDVLTKSAPAASAARQVPTIASSDSAADSMITLSTVGCGTASRTAAMSACTDAKSPAVAAPRSITMSTSCAPSRTARDASAALIALWCFPEGKPHTVATLRSEPAGTATGSTDGETHTE